MSGSGLVVLGRLVGVDPVEHAGALADLDEISVGIAEIAPYLGFAVEWFGKELCPFGFGVGVERCDVGDAHVQK